MPAIALSGLGEAWTCWIKEVESSAATAEADVSNAGGLTGGGGRRGGGLERGLGLGLGYEDNSGEDSESVDRTVDDEADAARVRRATPCCRWESCTLVSADDDVVVVVVVGLAVMVRRPMAGLFFSVSRREGRQYRRPVETG